MRGDDERDGVMRAYDAGELVGCPFGGLNGDEAYGASLTVLAAQARELAELAGAFATRERLDTSPRERALLWHAVARVDDALAALADRTPPAFEP
jgi:hypothetical protein